MDTRRQELLTILGHAMAGASEATSGGRGPGSTPHSARGTSSPCWSMPPIGSRPGRDRRARPRRGVTHDDRMGPSLHRHRHHTRRRSIPAMMATMRPQPPPCARPTPRHHARRYARSMTEKRTLFTTVQAAEILGIDQKSVQSAIMRGTLESELLSPRLRVVSQAAIDAYRAHHLGQVGHPTRKKQRMKRKAATEAAGTTPPPPKQARTGGAAPLCAPRSRMTRKG